MQTFLLVLHSPSPRWHCKPTHSPTPLPSPSNTAGGLFCWDNADSRKRTPAASHHCIYLTAPVSTSCYGGDKLLSEASSLPEHWICLLFATQVDHSSNCPVSPLHDQFLPSLGLLSSTYKHSAVSSILKNPLFILYQLSFIESVLENFAYIFSLSFHSSHCLIIPNSSGLPFCYSPQKYLVNDTNNLCSLI